MATEFKLPELGESADSGTLVKILVSAGDTVSEGQTVLEVEAGKSVVEVPSSVSGTIQEVAVEEGATIKPGDTIFRMSENGAAGAASSNGAAAGDADESGARAAAQQVQSTQAQAGEDAVTETAAATTAAGDAPASSAPDSSAGTVANAATQPTNAAAQQADTPRSTPAANGSAPAPPQSTPAQPKTEITPNAKREPAPAAPSVRRLARELGVDIHEVQGSGLGGRISEDDVKQHTRKVVTAAASGSGIAAGVSAAPLPDFSKWGAIETQPLSGIRTATAQQMSRAWAAPHVTQHDKADITDLEAMRKQFGKRAEERGGKLTVTAIALKVVVAALKRFPQFNASLDLANGQLVLKQYYHIGVAVDTDSGLLVPVIRDVDKKSIFELASELSEVGEKARARKIGLEDMQGGTFTITNLGGIGGTSFTPIVNVPEVAILGIARGQKEPKWNGESFEPRLMLPLSLSYDHRAIDGADGARFVRFIAELMEQPMLMAFEG